MSVDAAKGFLGIAEFFSILLPGALVTYVALADPPQWLFPDPALPASAKWASLPAAGTGGFAPATNLADAMIFLFLSYLIGHLIFLICSAMEDVQDEARRTGLRPTSPPKVNNFPAIKRGLGWLSKITGAALVYWDDLVLVTSKLSAQGPTTSLAEEITRNHTLRVSAEKITNAYQWAKVVITLEKPEALGQVLRFETDSKFFRSLVLVFLFGPFLMLSSWETCYGFVGWLLLPWLYWRYVDQRTKALRLACCLLIALEVARKDGYRTATSPCPTVPES